MNGVTIIAEYAETKMCSPGWALDLVTIATFTLIASLVGLFIAIILAVNYCDGVIPTFWISISAFIISVVAMILCVCAPEIEKPTGRTIYEIIITDEASYTELTERYEILEQHGDSNVYTVIEKSNKEE